MVRSAIGAATIVVGFYAAVWGQAQEKKMVEDCPTNSHESSSPRVPLLHNKSSQVWNYCTTCKTSLKPFLLL